MTNLEKELESIEKMYANGAIPDKETYELTKSEIMRQMQEKAEALADEKRKAEAEIEAKRRAEEEAHKKRIAEMEEAKRRADEELEAKRRTEAEAAAKRRADEEHAKHLAEMEEAKRKEEAEIEAKRRADEEAHKKRMAEIEAEARRKAEAATIRSSSSSVSTMQPNVLADKTIVELSNLSKDYKGGFRTVINVNLSIKEKEFVVLSGPGGCGKSTLLRMIAGYEDITNGEIRIDGNIINNIPAIDRNVTMTAQDFYVDESNGLMGAKAKARLNRGALAAEMTVYENIAYDLQNKKVPKNVIDERINDTLTTLNIDKYIDKQVKRLSTGNKWKLSFARSIIRNPKLYLFDDPFENVEGDVFKNQLAEELAKLFRDYICVKWNKNASILLATKDANSPIIKLADRVINMKHGEIL